MRGQCRARGDAEGGIGGCARGALARVDARDRRRADRSVAARRRGTPEGVDAPSVSIFAIASSGLAGGDRAPRVASSRARTAVGSGFIVTTRRCTSSFW